MVTLASRKHNESEARASLLRAPNWSQLKDSMGTYGPDSNSTMDCGEECLAMLLFLCRGVEVPAGYIRWLMGVRDGAGTTGDQLVAYLKREGFHDAVCRWPTETGAWPATLQLVKAGRVSIILGDWLDKQVGHWMIPLAGKPSELTVFDPWAGVHRTLSKSFFLQRFKGQLVTVGELPSYPRPGMAFYT